MDVLPGDKASDGPCLKVNELMSPEVLQVLEAAN